MKRGIDKAKDIILDFFDEITIPCIELKYLNRIALVSSNYDKNIADIVSKAVYEVGIDGAIDIEPGY